MLEITLNRDYIVSGQGQIPVIAFHGFSQSPEAFDSLAIKCPELTIYSFSLYGHPHTTPHYSQQEWVEAMKKWLALQKWKTFKVIAFSLGGRNALTMALAFSNISKLVLLAPDGLHPHPIFQLATGNSLGRYFFKKVLQTSSIPWLGHILTKAKLLPPFTIRFLEQQFSTLELRMRVYHTWMHYSSWAITPSQVTKIGRSATSIGIIEATKDWFVPKKGGRILSKKSTDAHIMSLPCDHFYLLSHYISYYEELPEWAQLHL